MTDSKKIDDGGPAYPQLDVTACERDGHGDLIEPFTSVSGGMSLRDWFAGQALAGLVGNPGGPYQANSQSGWDIVNCNVNHVATTCYELADAMIAARKGGAA